MSTVREERRSSLGQRQALPEPLSVPRTPLESRQGFHPKSDAALVWKTPPTRQLSREKRLEYECDIRERFYDDYIGQRNTGDVGHDVLTGVHKLHFDPAIYRANALQALVYDPARVVPSGVDLHGALRTERTKERQRHVEEHRRRRLSDSHLMVRSNWEQQQFQLPKLVKQDSALQSAERPRSALQKSIDNAVSPTIVPKVEDWLSSATKPEQETAEKFFSVLSSGGKQVGPEVKAALHKSRARSAVMTPSHKSRQDQEIQSTFEQLKKKTKVVTKQNSLKSLKHPNAQSDSIPTSKGSMFAHSSHDPPSHYTIHPQWASESVGFSTKKLSQ